MLDLLHMEAVDDDVPVDRVLLGGEAVGRRHVGRDRLEQSAALLVAQVLVCPLTSATRVARVLWLEAAERKRRVSIGDWLPNPFASSAR